ncbi:DUF1080 domain-containing protein [Aureitalea sp. L0-47]|uniref:DUF1080 domain-containing protein n=1 Tax=Aureitalea sp. L0-47 TaxID=2816962 RepID=UPI0022371959|nr:DUF1080 domain-containing protein [Aureitalea sp. L0-47]MCW5518767.1 DUF1080 domain-containing protein [Aureitalea sp. L0-47]
MFKNLIDLTGLLCAITLFISCANEPKQKLFNGESLDGWEGNSTFFRVENEAIVGGSLQKVIDKGHYLCTTKKYENFELKLAAKFVTSDLKSTEE